MPKFILSYFSPIEKIGEGLAKAVYLFVLDSHGIVHKCCNRKSGHLVTVKRIKLNWSDPASHSTAISEAALLKELRHPNIVNLEQVFLDCGDIYLIYEYLPLDLRSYMDLEYKGTGLPPDTVKLFMYQMLQALKYCHTRLIIHRALKPQNVLVDVNRQIVKLTDFELAKTFGYPRRSFTNEGASLWCCAPEILLGDAVYGCGVDMWSMGCIFAELVTGDPLFCGDSGIDQLFHIFRIMGVPTEESWPGVTMLQDYNFNSFPSWYQNRLSSRNKIVRALDAKGFDLLTMLLRYDPLSRMFAQRALLHPYFGNLDKNLLSSVSGEYVGLTAGEIPPTLVKMLEDLLSIASSELVVKKEEEGIKNEEKEGTLGKTVV
ncbi:unnamed protein product [Taenia asiatica]|uniref:Protein kinase domain-containing protein n=1 Tax=Taenia asiatica TaxID=60517 RepID=A0A0R3VZB8_TAEAS|nr:unnamed protein product [Taenia asiatica]